MARSSSCTLLVLLGLSTTALGATPLQLSVVSPQTSGISRILDAGTPVDFGTTTVGTSVSQVILVRNAGTETVQLANRVKLPKGFTLMRRFGTNVLAPGGTTTFTMALNSAVAGPLGGPVTVTYQGAKAGKAIFAVAGTAFGPPSLRLVTNSDPGFQTTGQWAAAPRADSGKMSVAAAGTGANTAAWTFTGLKPGQYQVAVTWAAGNQRATNAGFTVLNGKVPFTAVPVNQRQAPADFQDAGQGWKILGQAYRITSDTLTVQLTDRANGSVVADAVRIARVGFPGRILSPGEAGVTLSGAKLATLAVAGQGLHVVRQGAATGQTTWTFSGLVPGQYRISTTWNDNPKGATNLSYTILDGTRALTTVTVNQRQAPADLVDAGQGWKDLGSLGALYYSKSKSLVVRLNLAGLDGPVDVGPIRIERIYNPGGSPPPDGGPDGTTYADAVRFLEESTWGPNDTEVNNVIAMGIAGYLYNQLNATYTGFPVLTLPTDDGDKTHAGTTCDQNVYQGEDQNDCQRNNYQTYPLQRAFFTNGLYGPDQLRQRVAWSLHKMWVVSALSYNIPARMSYYLQVLDQNALGNYWDIMNGITLNPAMGDYLNLDNSGKNAPNENYAREILQLFTIGLNQLNPDGTLILDNNGNPIPTYDQNTIVNFAKAFTGWTKASPLPPINGHGVTNYRDPMVVRMPVTSYHDQTQKTLLRGEVIPAGQQTADDLYYALNNIWNDPSLAPFVSKSLIQQLTTSNPTPDYVARVAQTFLDDGTGTQGNLQAVAFAILTDPDVRGDVITDPTYGKLREPAQMVLNLLRAFNAASYDLTDYSDGYLNPQITGMDQDVLRPATVFSYFMPGWNLPNDASGLGLAGPEFQLFTSVNTFRRINMVNTLFMNGNNYGVAPSTNGSRTAPKGTRPDLSYLASLNDNDPVNAPYQMADYLNYLLLHGNMSSGMYGYLDGQGGGDGLVYAIYKVAPTNSLKRAQTAVYLVGSSSQYQIQQ